MEANEGTAVRKRGLKMIGVAILVLVLLLVLMGVVEPDHGPVSIAAQPFIHAGWIGSVLSFALGLFHTIVGAPGLGPFRLVRTPIAVLIGVFTMPIGLFGSWILHTGMSYEGDRTHRGDDVDFDWD